MKLEFMYIGHVSEVVEEIWCETCQTFSSDRSSLVGDYNICRVILK